jgi:three-Cys-motif partner protein
MESKSKEFFDQMSEQSEAKTEIVRKYFWAWAKIISKQVKKRGQDKIGYVDLFAGKGRYADDSKSTPLLILEGAVRDQEISQMLVTIFNDADLSNVTTLREEIKALPGINLLKYQPIVTNIKVGDALAQRFEEKSTIPTLFFLDP